MFDFGITRVREYRSYSPEGCAATVVFVYLEEDAKQTRYRSPWSSVKNFMVTGPCGYYEFRDDVCAC